MCSTVILGGQPQQGGGLGCHQDCPILQTLHEEAQGEQRSLSVLTSAIYLCS